MPRCTPVGVSDLRGGEIEPWHEDAASQLRVPRRGGKVRAVKKPVPGWLIELEDGEFEAGVVNTTPLDTFQALSKPGSKPVIQRPAAEHHDSTRPEAVTE